ncbi:uncharacterized protein THITE_2110405 [Thermothielavioides terrestris NRRL 8126]|uniref:Uncharacterized protein n=1 Tax=Thermothielavioides terrestris (strain ATCC 38088 / NRRL 8126) TaxID=578455 RepID=G2QSR1_THETT|nr:uncharacterized protein THITE_2110405 [Thermothielavioides terrestris NRRL 8126]AEO64344.1 hypothetical protein THITE_2110405 [Thermothielavioides terrestris NRRL 8126]
MPGIPLGALDNLKGKLKAVFKKRGEKKSEKKAKDKAKQAADQNTAEGGTAAAAAEATKTETATAPAGKSPPPGDLTSPLDISSSRAFIETDGTAVCTAEAGAAELAAEEKKVEIAAGPGTATETGTAAAPEITPAPPVASKTEEKKAAPTA